MSTPIFTATTDGLSASIEALGPIVASITAYFTDPQRALSSPAAVIPGEWATTEHASYGPPGAVIIGPGTYERRPVGVAGPGGFTTRWAPGDYISLSAELGARVAAVRWQNFNVWIHGLAHDGAAFATTAPGAAYALAQMRAATVLSDLFYAAFRDMLGHDIPTAPGKPLGPERGEFGYGSVLVETIGPLPIPIVGDVFALVPAGAFEGSVSGVPATATDPVEVS